MHYRSNYLLLVTGILLVASCTKKVNAISNPTSSISFFNASEYVQSEILNTNAAEILIDAPDATYPNDATPAASYPSFSRGSELYQYPASLSNTVGIEPWINYTRILPGTHTVMLMDTGMHHTLTTTRVETAPDLPVTLYYSDSLGLFRTFILRDTVKETDNAIQLRVLDLSPDAGKVFFTIDSLPATGFPDTLQYGTITPFTPWTNLMTGTLQIYFYNAGDSVDVLATAPMSVTPGHAYDVIFTGYANFESFPDPVNPVPASGSPLYFSPDVRILVIQIN